MRDGVAAAMNFWNRAGTDGFPPHLDRGGRSHAPRTSRPASRARASSAARGGGVVGGVPSGAVGLIAWWLRETTSRTVLVVATESERVYADSLVWDGGSGVAIFPAGDTPPFDRIPPSEEVTRARLATLMRLHAGVAPLLVVASPRGLLRPTLSRAVVEAGLTEVKRGARLPRDRLVARLVELGYRRESAVSSPGDFAVRGGIVDVFGVDRARPWRAEWFGDDVEDLRAFDPATQESIAKLESAQVWPARELDLSREVGRPCARVGRPPRLHGAPRRRARAVGRRLRTARRGGVRGRARPLLPVPR